MELMKMHKELMFKLLEHPRNKKKRNGLLVQLYDEVLTYQYEFIVDKIGSSIRDKRDNIPWSAEDKAIALKIHLYKPKIYKILIKYLNFPSVSALKSSMNNPAKEKGFFTTVLWSLEKLSYKMSENDKLCIISFDHIVIQNLKMIDDATKVEHQADIYGDKSHGLIFMASGICKNWKQPIGNFFSEKLTPLAKLKRLLLEAIKHMQNANFTVVAVICENVTVNKKLYRSLQITPEKPCFEVNEQKIFALYDATNLLKLLCNDFKKHDVVHFNNDKSASWQHIEKLHALSSSASFKIAPGLHKDDLAITGLKDINNELALEVFQYKVASFVGILAMSPKEPCPGANDTAEFVFEIFDLTNIINRRESFGAKKWNSVFSVNSNSEDWWKLKENFIKSLRFKKDPSCFSSLPCLEEWLITISAVKQLWLALKNQSWRPFLVANRLNLDCLRNTLHAIQESRGFKDNPSVCTFISAMHTQTIDGVSKQTKIFDFSDSPYFVDNDAKVLINFKVLEYDICATFFAETS